MKPRGPGVSGPAFHDPSHWTRPGGDLPTGAPKRHASRALRRGQTEAGVGGRKPSSRSWSLTCRVKKWRARHAMRHGGQPVPPRMTGFGVMRSLSPATCSLSSPPTMREVPEISAGSRNIRVPPQANSPVHIVELRASNVRPHSKTDNRLHESLTDAFLRDTSAAWIVRLGCRWQTPCGWPQCLRVDAIRRRATVSGAQKE